MMARQSRTSSCASSAPARTSRPLPSPAAARASAARTRSRPPVAGRTGVRRGGSGDLLHARAARDVAHARRADGRPVGDGGIADRAAARCSAGAVAGCGRQLDQQPGRLAPLGRPARTRPAARPAPPRRTRRRGVRARWRARSSRRRAPRPPPGSNVRCASSQPIQQPAQVGDAAGPLVGQVALFVRVGRQVVIGAQPLAHVADQLLAAQRDHAAVLELGERGRQARRRRRGRPQPRAEVGPAHARRHGDVEEVQHRRRDVDQLDLPVDDVGSQPGDRHDQRDVQLLFVQRRAVIPAAVLLELLAVVGRHDHDGAGPARAHLADQPPDGGVGVGDLAVVAIDVAAAEREAVVGDVGLVRLEEVDPHERALRLDLVVVRQQLVDAALGVDVLELHVLEVEVAVGERLQLVGVDEEDRRRVEGGRLPPELAQDGRGGVVPLAGREAHHRREVLRGQHRRNRERRVRRLRVGPREADALARQRVEVGRRRARVAVGAHVIGPQRVDGDQQDVGLAPARPVRQRRQRDRRVLGRRRRTGRRGARQRRRDPQRHRRQRRPFGGGVAQHLAAAQAGHATRTPRRDRARGQDRPSATGAGGARRGARRRRRRPASPPRASGGTRGRGAAGRCGWPARPPARPTRRPRAPPAPVLGHRARAHTGARRRTSRRRPPRPATPRSPDGPATRPRGGP